MMKTNFILIHKPVGRVTVSITGETQDHQRHWQAWINFEADGFVEIREVA